MKVNLLIATFFYLLLTSCTEEGTEVIPDVSHLSPAFSIHRFDKDMGKLSLAELQNKYPLFAEVFFKNVVPIYRDPNPENLLDTITSEQQYQRLVDTCQLVFGDMSDIKRELTQAFQYLEYYLPAIDAPDIYTYVSGFAHQIFLYEEVNKSNGVGLGLDMFLGAQFPYQSVAPENAAFSDYLTRSFNKAHIPRRVIEVLLQDYMPPPTKLQLLDQMLHNGKKLYLLDKILPTSSDTIIMEYSADQLQWVEDNVLEMWAFFLKENLFYESNSQKINKYINPSPHSPGMPPAAPGRTGNYLGWQIVKSYMMRYPETTIEALLEDRNAQEFLQKARYKPRRK